LNNYEHIPDEKLIEELNSLEGLEKRDIADELHLCQIKLELKDRELKKSAPAFSGNRESSYTGELYRSGNKHGEEEIKEHKLQLSEELFFGLFDSMTSGSAIYHVMNDGSKGSDYIIIGFNRTGLKMTGKSRDDVIGISLADLKSNVDNDKIISVMKKVRETGNPDFFAEKVCFDDGSCRYFETDIFKIPTGDIVTIYNDVTERREMEEALRVSEEKFRTIANYTVDWESWFGPDGKFIWVNPAVKNFTGYTPEEILAIPDFISTLVAEEDREMARNQFQHALANGTSGEDFECRYIHRDGSVFWLNISWQSIFDSKGTFLGIRTSGRNITRQKQAEEAILESEERFRALSEYSHNAICIIDEKARILWVNNRMLDLSGYTREQVLGADSFLAFLAPESLEFVVNNYMKFVSGEPYEHYYQFYFIKATGEKCLVEKYMTDCTDRKGKRNLMISMLDITEKKKAEIERQKLQEQLIHAQKMESVGRLAGGVAHDFNNMLGIILGSVEISMYNLQPSDRVYKNLERIRRAAERSANLTRQLLAFARKQLVSPAVLDLNDTVDGMLKMLRRIIGEDIEMLWKPAPNLASVKMDPAQIDQIMANLLVNARDAIDGVGRVIIETGNASFDEDYCALHKGFIPGEYVMLSVSDTGCGMDRETLDNIFEPFFTTKELGKGTGLGLATVYGIVSQNNGFINVYSEPGSGTTFNIYLPRYEGYSYTASAKEPDEPVKGGNETVLLVEDEKILLELAEAMLKQLGYKVLAANTAGDAISLAWEYAGEIHLLITDVVMPEMNGRELAGYLMSRYPALKCLFMSGYTANVIAHQGVLDEGVHFVQKPFSIKNLASSVREALEQRSEK